MQATSTRHYTEQDARLEYLAAYLVELALCEYGALHFLPSCIAAAAVLVAQFSLDVRVWSPTLEHYTRYGPADLQVLNHKRADARFAVSALRAKYLKNAEQRCLNVSNCVLLIPFLVCSYQRACCTILQ